MSGYIKTFKHKDGDKKNKLISLHMDHNNLLEKSLKRLN